MDCSSWPSRQGWRRCCFGRDGQGDCRNQGRDGWRRHTAIRSGVSDTFSGGRQSCIFFFNERFLKDSLLSFLSFIPKHSLCNSDDTVEVGSDLYELDTEAEATVEAGQVSAPAPEVAPAPVAAEPVPTAAAPSLRVPSIQFLGKAGWEKRLKGGDSPSVVVVDLPRMYGRPEFSEEEMEALIMGGATLTPEVVSPSRGAKFKYL